MGALLTAGSSHGAAHDAALDAASSHLGRNLLQSSKDSKTVTTVGWVYDKLCEIEHRCMHALHNLRRLRYYYSPRFDNINQSFSSAQV